MDYTLTVVLNSMSTPVIKTVTFTVNQLAVQNPGPQNDTVGIPI